MAATSISVATSNFGITYTNSKNKSDNIISANKTDNSKTSIGGLSGNNGSGSSHSNSYNHIGITIDDNDSDNNVYNNENDSSGTNIGKKTK